MIVSTITGSEVILDCGVLNGYLVGGSCSGVCDGQGVEGITLNAGSNILQLWDTSEHLTTPVHINLAAYINNGKVDVYCNFNVSFEILNYDAFGVYASGATSLMGLCDSQLYNNSQTVSGSWIRQSQIGSNRYIPQLPTINRLKGTKEGYPVDLVCALDSLGGTLLGNCVNLLDQAPYKLALSRPIQFNPGVVEKASINTLEPGKYEAVAGGSVLCEAAAVVYMLTGLVGVISSPFHANDVRTTLSLQGDLGCKPDNNFLPAVDLRSQR